MAGTGVDRTREAAEHGRICALAVGCERDLRACAEAHPDLFSGAPFDSALFTAVSMANAFGSPDAGRERLEVANRTSLWIFALDWLIDYRARSRPEVEQILDWCRTAAVTPSAPDAAAGGPPLARLLGEIRDRLAVAPAFAAYRDVWLGELHRMLDAMALEWEWKTAGKANGQLTPSFEQYLGNADNFGSTFVNVSHWLSGSSAAALARLDELLEVSREVQRVLRLLNDLATYERDVTWGDLNALLLDVDRATVQERIGELVDRCETLLDPLRDDCPDETVYLGRQIGYSMGFYGAADYWGRL
ncbi:hypothetical protein OHR68_42880 [Spirillospora sp. NBC_00431]